MRRRRRHTLRFNQQPRPPRRPDRTFAYFVATMGGVAVAWAVFSTMVLR